MRKVVFAVFASCGLTIGWCSKSVATEDGRATDIGSLIERVKSSAADDNERGSLAMQLSTLVVRMDRSQLDMIDKNTIDKLASLLKGDSDVVIYAAAIALGHIGEPAVYTVPSLLDALREIQFGSRSSYRDVDYGSIDAIVDALERLNVCKPTSRRVSRSSCDYLLR